jgi:hypothetical protein
MKKNEIRFIATENGINCEGNATLSQADRNKVEQMLQQVQNAAKDCGATLSLSPIGIQLGFNVALTCDAKCINEAETRMRCIIEQMREFISNSEPLKKDEPQQELSEDDAKEVAAQQDEECATFFKKMHEKYPNAGITVICDDNKWVSVSSNMSITDVMCCMIGAKYAQKDGNQ